MRAERQIDTLRDTNCACACLRRELFSRFNCFSFLSSPFLSSPLRSRHFSSHRKQTQRNALDHSTGERDTVSRYFAATSTYALSRSAMYDVHRNQRTYPSISYLKTQLDATDLSHATRTSSHRGQLARKLTRTAYRCLPPAAVTSEVSGSRRPRRKEDDDGRLAGPLGERGGQRGDGAPHTSAWLQAARNLQRAMTMTQGKVMVVMVVMEKRKLAHPRVSPGIMGCNYARGIVCKQRNSAKEENSQEAGQAARQLIRFLYEAREKKAMRRPCTI
ncbi:hypothetical protein BKA81DRAFT_398394 [Phyllosticta paracitricarpa]|uniref:Uncharacterized protein n=1 Tax=Phyllosticta citricarpa TaxID=55181 RepID=A0ABR1MRA0_9PEZI